jgi:hypothetical protein
MEVPTCLMLRALAVTAARQKVWTGGGRSPVTRRRSQRRPGAVPATTNTSAFGTTHDGAESPRRSGVLQPRRQRRMCVSASTAETTSFASCRQSAAPTASGQTDLRPRRSDLALSAQATEASTGQRSGHATGGSATSATPRLLSSQARHTSRSVQPLTTSCPSLSAGHTRGTTSP